MIFHLSADKWKLEDQDPQWAVENKDLLSMEPWLHPKSFKLVWRCHQFLSEFLANGHLPRVLRQSTNDKSDEMILEAVHRSPGIYLTAEENPEKNVS